MTKEPKMETIMPQTDKEEAAEVLELLDAMNQGEQKEMLVFLRGVKLGMSLGAAEAARARYDRRRAGR